MKEVASLKKSGWLSFVANVANLFEIVYSIHCMWDDGSARNDKRKNSG